MEGPFQLPAGPQGSWSQGPNKRVWAPAQTDISGDGNVDTFSGHQEGILIPKPFPILLKSLVTAFSLPVVSVGGGNF